ncbi:acyl-CoA dehydratase activase-related protein [Clostridiaceae bacterium M8S5]|nr:acyl-CoA dehydratase activase-related protein [Clostridiaceae bacterium M8S5]
MKIGIPKGLLYYDYIAVWKDFFEELGQEVIISDDSNKKILTDGASKCIDDACLPVKLYHGHVMNLKDKVDYIFIPKIISVEKKTYQCPKILGLPAMIKQSIEGLPEILDTEINLRNRSYKKSIFELGLKFTKNIAKIKRAHNKGLQSLCDYESSFNNRSISHAIKKTINNSKGISTIMLAGHSYNLFDEVMNLNLIQKLNKSKVQIITPQMLNEHTNDYLHQIKGKIFWSVGKQIVGTCFYAVENKMIDGMIYISSFGCGLDSIIIDIVSRKCERNNVPFTVLVVDEHSGEAGFNTRLEAFLDMIHWRKKDEDNISTHG